MRRSTLLAIVMTFGAACAGPVAEEASQSGAALSPQQQQQEIQQGERDWVSAVVARDVAKLGQIYGDGLIYAHSSGVVESKSEYLGKLESGATRYDAIDYEAQEVRPYGDAAVAHSRVVMRGQNAEGPFNNRLMMIHVWIREGGQWRLVAHQTTLLEAVQ